MAASHWVAGSIVLLALPISARASAPSIDLFVSLDGDDAANNGSLAWPFQSLERARQEANALKLLPDNVDTAINVLLRAGRYPLASTLDFTAADSGVSATAPITYQAYCDPQVEVAGVSRLAFPYSTGIPPPRLLWNGLGDPEDWMGPADPFFDLGVNDTNNSMLFGSVPAPAIRDMDVGAVCVDTTAGHTCYADGPLATCVAGCQASCAADATSWRTDASPELTQRFAHLFGRNLSQHDDCVEHCARSCRGCERVELSGSLQVPQDGAVSWQLERTIDSTRHVFSADLLMLLPSLPADVEPAQPQEFATFIELFLNGSRLPRAGFPDCTIDPSVTESGGLSCSFAPLVDTEPPSTIVFNASSFSPLVAQWPSPSAAAAIHNDQVITVRPNMSEPAELVYSVAGLDLTHNRIQLGGGGAQLGAQLFYDGLPSSQARAAGFRVDNVLEELDAPGEWFFDAATRRLYVLPPEELATVDATLESLANATFEMPLLHQLLRVRGGNGVSPVLQSVHALESPTEPTTTPPAAHLRFRHLVFSGTQLHHLSVSDCAPGATDWPLARVAAVFLESVDDVAVEHCTFEHTGGNALVVSGGSTNVTIAHNNVSLVGGSGIAVLPKPPVNASSLQLAVQLNVSFNQVHHVGQRLARSAALLVVGAQTAVVAANLVFAVPPAPWGAAFVVRNAVGPSAASDVAPLVRPLVVQRELPNAPDVDLLSVHAQAVPVAGADIPVVAKLVGAPPCSPTSGRVDSPFGDPVAFTSLTCSGCCAVHADSAAVRVPERGLAWTDPIVAASPRRVVVRPGESVELRAAGASGFRSRTDVFLGFHVETPNAVIELSGARAAWRLETRGCVPVERVYTATCGGPCGGCGINNADANAALMGGSLACDVGDEADVTTHVCTGPFEDSAACGGSLAASPRLFYNCSVTCVNFTCT